MAFHVGQMVVCVLGGNPDGDGYGWEEYPVKGRFYTVRSVLTGFTGEAVRLEEIRNKEALYEVPGGVDQHEMAFYSMRFRPVRTTSIDRFTSLLNPQPDTVSA
ncbi:hypothetical protein [Aestuariivirga sp.]|uniref:hypothetical protein n=1 Tax=Aestuariivirga sp. TaxID=2650926 RepID=UPI0039E3846D